MESGVSGSSTSSLAAVAAATAAVSKESGLLERRQSQPWNRTSKTDLVWERGGALPEQPRHSKHDEGYKYHLSQLLLECYFFPNTLEIRDASAHFAPRLLDFFAHRSVYSFLFLSIVLCLPHLLITMICPFLLSFFFSFCR